MSGWPSAPLSKSQIYGDKTLSRTLQKHSVILFIMDLPGQAMLAPPLCAPNRAQAEDTFPLMMSKTNQKSIKKIVTKKEMNISYAKGFPVSRMKQSTSQPANQPTNQLTDRQVY